MKRLLVLLTAVCFAAGATSSQAQTLNWGSEAFSDLTDSNGNTLDESLFVFELGSFVNGFVPDDSNTDEWFLNWRVFDTASYEQDNGYFSSTVYIENDVTSSNPSASTISFAGLEAYIWIRNDEDPVEGTEWFLARASDWTFPTTGGDCCDTEVIEWSVSDLTTTDIPEWGRHGGTEGPGEYTVTGTTGLQTYTFVPEPSTAIMAAIAGLGLVLRRRR
jgi:hypothetical protein